MIELLGNNADQVVVLARGKVVAQGSVDEVRARVAQKQIRCPTKLDIDGISGWSGVQNVRMENDRM